MKKVKRSATLLDNGQVEFVVDSKTTVTRFPKESDYESWPDLDRPAPKSKRKRRKVKHDDKGDAESGASGNGI